MSKSDQLFHGCVTYYTLISCHSHSWIGQWCWLGKTDSILFCPRGWKRDFPRCLQPVQFCDSINPCTRQGSKKQYQHQTGTRWCIQKVTWCLNRKRMDWWIRQTTIMPLDNSVYQPPHFKENCAEVATSEESLWAQRSDHYLKKLSHSHLKEKKKGKY